MEKENCRNCKCFGVSEWRSYTVEGDTVTETTDGKQRYVCKYEKSTAPIKGDGHNTVCDLFKPKQMFNFREIGVDSNGE